MAVVVNNDTSTQEAEQRTIRSILDQGKTTITLRKVNNDNLSEREMCPWAISKYFGD
jgi:hypothetical protein